MACGLLLFAVFLGCRPSVGGTATVPVSRTVVRGRHILTRKEYLDTFAGDTAGWAQYMEDQYFAEQGVSLTADAEALSLALLLNNLLASITRIFETHRLGV